MKIYITGIAGFLGSHLAEYLLKQGHKVYGCDNLFGGYIDNIPANAVFQIFDIEDTKRLAEAMSGCKIVYHCAAAAYEGISVFSPAFISRNIYAGSASVFSAAVTAEAKRVVFCSSMARYGNAESPFDEYKTQCSPVDPYGCAKLASEYLLKNLSDTHGIEYSIAIPHNIYGPRQKYDDPYRNVASIMINRILQNKSVIVYGDGSQKRCFSYIDDVVPCLAKMGTEPSLSGSMINLGPDNEFISIKTLATRLSEIMRVSLDIHYVAERPCEVKEANCLANRARNLLGFESKTCLEDGLYHLVDYIRKKGPKSFDYNISIEIQNEQTPRTWTERLF